MPTVTRVRDGKTVKVVCCESCEPLVIQGLISHEQGCPDAWKDEVRECRWCGTDFVPEERGQRFCDEDCAFSYGA